MGETRTKRTIVNASAGIVNKIISIIMPFLGRTTIIYVLGMEYAGLNGLFSSVLQVLNLAEMGLSSAIVFCMYKPMAENDTELLCALYGFMRKLYYIIGTGVAVIGIALIPFLHIFIHGDMPEGLSLITLYLIYLVNTVIGYFFFAYKSTLLNAGQQVGVLSNLNTIVTLLLNGTQIVVLILFRNYYVYLLILPITTVLNNLFVSIAVKKRYPDIICKSGLDNYIKQNVATRVKGLFLSKISTTTRNAFDSIFISSFIGLSTVAIYGNYYYIMSAVTGILSVVTVAMTASVGNSIVTESVEKNYSDLITFNFIFNWIVGYFTCCMLVMYQPFMEIWMGKKGLFPFGMVVLFCLYFYMLNIGSIRAVYHDAAGLWWEARYRSFFEAILNLALNYILTKRLGVFGTVLGTLIAMIIVNYGYGTQIVFQYYFHGISCMEYFEQNLVFLGATIAGSAVVKFICGMLTLGKFPSLVVNFLICSVLFNAVYFLLLCRTKVFAKSKVRLKSILCR